MNTSLYLSQSYKDAWDDYNRSLNIPSFPTWDYIILTASNELRRIPFSYRLTPESPTFRLGLPSLWQPATRETQVSH